MCLNPLNSSDAINYSFSLSLSSVKSVGLQIIFLSSWSASTCLKYIKKKKTYAGII